ncbi:alpha/beta fold hydrolase [Candidatus Saccharibacteria bacterium]|nr:alpha/beta fold hydrolase [Candidatus Saccharibacteria bacterium]
MKPTFTTTRLTIPTSGAPYHIDVRTLKPARPGGRSFILIHGIGVSGRYFMPLALKLARHHTVYVLDLPGHGDTPKPARALDIRQLATVVNAFVHHQHISRPILVGHSMGCQIAAKAIELAPRLHGGIILLSPTVNRYRRNRLLQAYSLLCDGLREPLRVNLIAFGDYLQFGLARYLRTSSFMMRDRLEQSIRHCPLPGLIVRGGRDPITSDRWLDYLCRSNPRFTPVRLNDGPHVIQYTHAVELADICEGYVLSLE